MDEGKGGQATERIQLKHKPALTPTKSKVQPGAHQRSTQVVVSLLQGYAT